MLDTEFIDLDGGDGDGVFDADDLAVATAAFRTEVGAGHALPNSDEEGTYIWRYYYKDYLGGNTIVTDSAGDVVSSMRYHPYGKTELQGVTGDAVL